MESFSDGVSSTSELGAKRGRLWLRLKVTFTGTEKPQLPGRNLLRWVVVDRPLRMSELLRPVLVMVR